VVVEVMPDADWVPQRGEEEELGAEGLTAVS
jgi:hypothetical protein